MARSALYAMLDVLQAFGRQAESQDLVVKQKWLAETEERRSGLGRGFLWMTWPALVRVQGADLARPSRRQEMVVEGSTGARQGGRRQARD